MKSAPQPHGKSSEVARRLIEEFADSVPPETIEAVIEDSVNRWADAPVKTFVPVLAERHARERLREMVGAQRAG